MYTFDDILCSIMSLYPGKRTDIIEYGKDAEKQADLLELDGDEKALYIDDYIRDCLD